MFKSGIYSIINSITNHIYIGSSINIFKRWKVHQTTLKRNKHPNIHLQNAYNKYGKERLNYSILENVDKKYLIDREQYWIDLAISEESKLYNCSNYAIPTKNRILSQESRKQISNKLKSQGIKPPSRINIGFGFCKLYCPKGHYKTQKSLIHGSNSCKECQRLKSYMWRQAHKN